MFRDRLPTYEVGKIYRTKIENKMFKTDNWGF